MSDPIMAVAPPQKTATTEYERIKAVEDRLDTAEAFTVDGTLPTPVQSTLDGRYVLAAGDIWIPANHLEAVNGSPTYAVLSAAVGYWTMPTTGNPGVGGAAVLIPVGWATADISVVWMNLSASSGNAVLRGDYGQWGIGDTLSVTVGSNRTEAALTTANQTKKSTLESGVSVTPGEFLSVATLRISSGETLANTLGIVGILVEKAS